MHKSNLVPFLRKDLEILFIGLNPAEGSSRNRHYFSVNQAFWNQLHNSKLISQYVDKSTADDIVFGSNKINFSNWNYGITDLVIDIAESKSGLIKPTEKDCKLLKDTLIIFKPKTVVLLHGKVLKEFLKYLGYDIPVSNTGQMGPLIKSINTVFFNIAFPHGNAIPSDEKVKRYVELKEFIKNH
jgi:hypothetical protein